MLWLAVGLVVCGALKGLCWWKDRQCSLYLEAVNKSWDAECKRLASSKVLVVHSTEFQKGYSSFDR